MTDIENLDHRALQEHRSDIDGRIHELEERAVATLSHRPFAFAWRLIKAGVGFGTHPQEDTAS